MKKLAMISQPMAGRSTWEIDETRNRAIAELEQRGYYVVNTFLQAHGTARRDWKGRALSKSLFTSLQSHWKR